MNISDPWVNIVLDADGPAAAWEAVFGRLGTMAREIGSPVELHKQTQAPDRLIAESAWELWQAYPSAAQRTSQALIEWWQTPSGSAMWGWSSRSAIARPRLWACARFNRPSSRL